MRRTMNVWVFVACMCVMVLVFGVVNVNIASSITELEQDYQNINLQLADLNNEQDELEAELKTVGTDAFIEQQARDVYDYMMPDELRFVISFPEDNANNPSL